MAVLQIPIERTQELPIEATASTWDEVPTQNSSTFNRENINNFFSKFQKDRNFEQEDNTREKDIVYEIQSDVSIDKLIDLSKISLDYQRKIIPVIQGEFEKVFAATGQNKWYLAEKLRKHANVESLITVALHQFQERGNEERLVLAASMLESYGRVAIRVLRYMAEKNIPESEYFIDTLANLADETDYSDSIDELLALWASHKSKHVRSRLIEISQFLPDSLTLTLLTNLAKDKDEEISEAAKEILEDVQ